MQEFANVKLAALPLHVEREIELANLSDGALHRADLELVADVQLDSLLDGPAMQPNLALAIDINNRDKHRVPGIIESERFGLWFDVQYDLLALRYETRMAVVDAFHDELVFALGLGRKAELAGLGIELRIGNR